VADAQLELHRQRRSPAAWRTALDLFQEARGTRVQLPHDVLAELVGVRAQRQAPAPALGAFSFAMRQAPPGRSARLGARGVPRPVWAGPPGWAAALVCNPAFPV
jgi:hypothetical protein